MGGLPGGSGGGEHARHRLRGVQLHADRSGQAVDVTITGTVTDPSTASPRRASPAARSRVAPSRTSSAGTSACGCPTRRSAPRSSRSTPSPRSRPPRPAVRRTSPAAPSRTGDNSAKRNVIEYAPGGTQKQLLRVIDNGQGSIAADPRSKATRGPLPGRCSGATSSACEQRPVPVRERDPLRHVRPRHPAMSPASAAAGPWHGPAASTDAKVQYAAYDMTVSGRRPEGNVRRRRRPLVRPARKTSPAASTPSARCAQPATSGAAMTGTLYSYVTTEDAADGTRAYDFGHAWFGDRSERWAHDVWSDADLGAGPLSDSVILTENLARIQKKIVDPGPRRGRHPRRDHLHRRRRRPSTTPCTRRSRTARPRGRRPP